MFARKFFALRSFRQGKSQIKSYGVFFMNAKFSSPLNNVKVASPCSQDWNAMIGNERKRYCGDCKLNVYNLSGMSRTEAENLLSNSEGRLCVRFYRRADGSVLTQDCPVGWRAVKQRVSKTATAFASLIFGLIGGLGLNSYMKDSDSHTVGMMIPQTSNSNVEIEKPEIMMGAMPADYPMMGDVAFPTPEPSPTIKDQGQWKVGEKSPEIMGKVVSKNSPQM